VEINGGDANHFRLFSEFEFDLEVGLRIELRTECHLPKCRLGVSWWLYFDTMSKPPEMSRFKSEPRQLATQMHCLGSITGAHDAQ
jgi:hypothetical protein